MDLRLKIYRELGYLNTEIDCDLDPFDWSSIHFIATDQNDEIAGTVRIILAGADESQERLELSESQQWCTRFQEIHHCSILKSNSLPVLETLNDNRISAAELRTRNLAELSRVIVAPKHRGSGVCRRLCETVISEAERLKLDALYLQCLPSHEELFRRFGFESLLHFLDYRFLRVPDAVVVMRIPVGALIPRTLPPPLREN